MSTENYSKRIALYVKGTPNLSPHALGVMLTADSLYMSQVDHLPQFRKKYAHLNPELLSPTHDGVTFLKIVENNGPVEEIRERLNAYINLKFNTLGQSKSYDENMVVFKRYARITSDILDDILENADFPPELVSELAEREEVRQCRDFYGMHSLYKGAMDKRTRYEILRKLGLIVLIARINKSLDVEELENRMVNVWDAFQTGLGNLGDGRKRYYFWLDEKDKVHRSHSRKEAHEAYRRVLGKRRVLALQRCPLQSFVCHPLRTFGGNEVLHMEIRNKFKRFGRLSFTSYVEKMLRNTLEFPNQVHDTIGVKIVVNSEDSIPNIISDLESFLGGSSTRKMEKNSYHRFGRHELSEYSSSEYFVWKAIYDIILPHPSIAQINKLMDLTTNNPAAQEHLRGRLDYYVNNPRVFVIEVQLQDIDSYLLSIAKGSPTEHARLKMNQIRKNTFHKLFPKEIYENDILKLKLNLLYQEQ